MGRVAILLRVTLREVCSSSQRRKWVQVSRGGSRGVDVVRKVGVIDRSAVSEPHAAGDPSRLGQAARPRREPASLRRNWLYGVAILVTLGIVAFNIIRPITVLPRIAPSPGYALVDSNGQPATSEDRRGFLTLYSFSYLDCGEACPQSIGDIAALRAAVADALPPDTPIDFVTISVDPQRDTLQRLAEARAALGEDDDSIGWKLLTGDPLRVRYTVGGGFGVYFSDPKEPTAESPGRVTFDPRYVLVDHLGIMRAHYRTGAPDPALIARDVNLLVQEAEHSDGIARLGYEAAHLFLCYPR